MRLLLKVDYDGSPYLELTANGGYDAGTLDDLLEIFVREGLYRGVEIVNKSSLATCTSFAAIKLKGKKGEVDE